MFRHLYGVNVNWPTDHAIGREAPDFRVKTVSDARRRAPSDDAGLCANTRGCGGETCPKPVPLGARSGRLRTMRGWLVLALFTAGCGASVPIAPTPAVPLPLALAGQSNAWLMRDIFAAAYAPGRVVGFAQDGSYIDQWAPNTDYWNRLATDLHQPLRAFIWWQGESDRWPGRVEIYESELRAFIARVRAEANDPNLLVVICRVIDDPIFAGVRAAQEAYVRSDPRSVLVSSDGLPLESVGSAHLNAAGYVAMSKRILAVIP